MPRVLNKGTDTIPPDAVYVGRPSKWGNPYIIGKDGTREEVIEKYRLWLGSILGAQLKGLISSHKQLSLNELRGQDLVCWCSPLPCHADILLELANRKGTQNE